MLGMIEAILLAVDIEKISSVGVSKIKDCSDGFDYFTVLADYLTDDFAVGGNIDYQLFRLGYCFDFDGAVIRDNCFEDIF